MKLYALVNVSLPEPIGVYARREDAEDMLRMLLTDEPTWHQLLSVEPFELGDSYDLDRSAIVAPPRTLLDRVATITLGR